MNNESSNVCPSDYSRALKTKTTLCNKELPVNSFQCHLSPFYSNVRKNLGIMQQSKVKNKNRISYSFLVNNLFSFRATPTPVNICVSKVNTGSNVKKRPSPFCYLFSFFIFKISKILCNFVFEDFPFKVIRNIYRRKRKAYVKVAFNFT